MTSILSGKRSSVSESRRGSATDSKRGSVSEPNVASTITPEILASIQGAEIFDQDGVAHTWGELTREKKTIVVFIRHFWCINCKAYCRLLAEQIPPSSLPEGTAVIIIGSGNHKPIKSYVPTISSTSGTPYPYPVYAHPSLTLHKALGFTSSLAQSKSGEEKAYESELGGMFKRTVAGMKGAHLGDFMDVGPKAQNGGEMVVEADGSCSFLYRMRHTADHTEIADLAKQIGATYVPGEAVADAMQCKA